MGREGSGAPRGIREAMAALLRATGLDAPIARVGAPFSPVPYSPALEAQYVPNADRIVAAVKQQLGL